MGGGSSLRGDGAREDARLEATIALAKSLPVLRGVIRLGWSMLYCAGIDLADCDDTDATSASGAASLEAGRCIPIGCDGLRRMFLGGLMAEVVSAEEARESRFRIVMGELCAAVSSDAETYSSLEESP
jgi:hypothetical protein